MVFAKQGGYLHHVYRYAARELAGLEVTDVPLELKRDYQEATLALPDGRNVVFAIVGLKGENAKACKLMYELTSLYAAFSRPMASNASRT